MKKCRSCGVVWNDPSEGFYKASWGGFRSPCKSCTSQLQKEYQEQNRDDQRIRTRKHYQENKEMYLDKYKKWASLNPERLIELRKNQRRKDAEKIKENRAEIAKTQSFKDKRNAYENEKRKCGKVRLENSVRSRICAVINGYEGALRHLDYSSIDLRKHIERQFLKGMSWENYGEWHLDHITPLSSFDMCEGPSGDNFKACWALSNLRPLWAEDNAKKKNKIAHLI